MRLFNIFNILVLSLLVGCASLGLERVHSDKPKTPAEVAQHAINEARATLVGLNVTIEQNVRSGTWSPDVGQAYLDRSRDARERLEQAQRFLGNGDISGAEAQTRAIEAIIKVLQREVYGNE